MTSLAAATALAAHELAEFDARQDSNRLYAAAGHLERLGGAPGAASERQRELRRETLRLWLGLLARIDAALDPTFDPDDPAEVPSHNITPPPVRGVKNPFQIDPAEIEDPVAREAYARRLADNDRKGARSRLQNGLRHLDSYLPGEVGDFIRRGYSPAPGDQEELTRAIEALIRAPARAQALRAMVPR